MPRMFSTRKPKDLVYTVRRLLSYMGRHRISLLAVAILVIVSVLCNLVGGWVADGMAPADYELLGGMIEDICFNNVWKYIGLDR